MVFRKLSTYVLLILSPLGLTAQYISEVREYLPAPGQFINSTPWGTPVSTSSLVGGVNGSLSLGAFGGSVVFRFEEAVENHPDNPYGMDFTIFGNATSEWSEPGVVWVMKDENGNNLPDDSWYELAGSDYHFSTTQREYEVSYTNPGGEEARDVPWTDSFGNSGLIKANSVHTQSYYPLADSFPDVPAEKYTLSGTLIQGAVDVDHPPLIKSLRRSFGYADNQIRGSGLHTLPDNPYTPEVEHSGGDAFDIAWAVNADGSYVDLDKIHFVKVQNGVLHEGGWLGEISTEISGAADVSPDNTIEGSLDCLVIQDLPAEVDTGTIQLELFMFHMGRPVSLPHIQWTSSEEWAWVDEENTLFISGNGALTLTAMVVGEPSLKDTISTLVIPEVQVGFTSEEFGSGPFLYPNPARDLIHVSGVEGVNLSLYESSGKMLRLIENYDSGDAIDIRELSPGFYFLKIGEGSSVSVLKLLRQ